MNIHESQAKAIFSKYGIPCHALKVAHTADEAFEAVQQLPKEDNGCYVVKAQVHAGARGKAGGVKLVQTAEEAKEVAQALLGTRLVTIQTGSEGKPVDSVLIESTTPIAKEYYASVVLDRSMAKPCLIVSEAGGMNIEEVAQTDPSKIIKVYFPIEGMDDTAALSAGTRLVANQEQAQKFAEIFKAIAKIFIELDCSLIEINPLAIMEDGSIIAIDAKINFDDNALYRHPDLAELRDERQEDPREVEAKKYDLSYVGLDGNIGCVVNGAGLAMATMDIIKYAGGEPANFLDVGGGANKEKVAAAFKIILRDPHVKAVLVNIFGGIMRCDVVAEGILAAVKEINPEGNSLPNDIALVVRLEGTNVNEGKALLEKSGLKIIAASEFEEAAKKVVEAVS